MISWLVALLLLVAALVPVPAMAQSTGYAEMYRLYNPNSGEHFYTANLEERDEVVAAGWNYEGVGWVAPTPSNTPVYRLYNPNQDPETGSGEHHYTMSAEERDTLVALGWQDEGVGWYSDDAKQVPLYRQYNPNQFNCNHNYTTSYEESTHLVSLGWNYEGVAWYGLSQVDVAFIATVSAGTDSVSTVEIVSTDVEDVPTLFLPAHANLMALALSFDVPNSKDVLEVSLDDGESWLTLASGGALDLSALVSAGSEGTLLWRIPGTSTPRTLDIMVSANVDALYITSDDAENKGRSYVEASEDHSAKASGSLMLVSPGGTLVYDGGLSQIKGRGNATWDLDKRPYQIKLSKKCDLLQTGDAANKAKAWVLLANRNDATGLQNSIAMQLALGLGLGSTTEFETVDLYYDGEYRGSYLLCEKVEVNSGRVDIYDLEGATEDANPDADLDELPLAQAANKYGQTFQYVEDVESPSDISGGYLLELDHQYWEAERCWFTTTEGTFVVKEPENCSYEEMLYISEFVQEAIINSGADESLRAEGTAVADWIDVDSFAKVYLVNQFAKNEGWWGSSTFFYLPAEGDEGYSHVLYAGPVWDFDTAYGLLNYNETERDDYSQPTGLYPFTMWYLDCPEVIAVVGELEPTANQLVAELTSGVLGDGASGWASFAQMVDEIHSSELMNECLWGYWTFGVCYDPYDTYDENVARLDTWMRERASWLSQNGWI